MRIKFNQDPDINPEDAGREFHIGGLRAVGDTIVAGYRVATNGKLKPFVEDITQYKIVDGEKVEITEVIPDETWKVADIKLWLDAQGISYTSSALKADLLALI